ncbi:hypothetical protein CcI49_02700 [Frankia sp. CcI49]|uniref:hypothetical protein n=1 Tax=Frankia sp. CcI49 TaxID=1745382 RepID=UPI0009772237|nr:hypothetical protein [Frankia sp. CcI49]ONH62304.1 hypothetical protein CcI49_02700 [Frankia sp. CcI49]
MTVLKQFDPPGHLTDLDANGRAVWSSFISEQFDASAAGRRDHLNDAPRARFYNPTRVDTAPDAQTSDISWIAFPRNIKVNSVADVQRWRRADASRDVQDEYCEWSVTRNEQGQITRVDFTCEGPEYWEVLAQLDPARVVRLYQEFVSPKVSQGDLFDASGNYVRRNPWNTGTVQGAMHLVQGANTLSAEIELAAAATIVRVVNDTELTSEQELIKCSQYGDATRNSDPHIGGVVNGLARLDADITLANPVGLYFDDLSTAGWESPDGSDPKRFWTYTRGEEGHPVRAAFEVPASENFTVSDIRVGGQPIRFGAQIADFISIRLTGVACRIGKSRVAPMPCVAPTLDVTGAPVTPAPVVAAGPSPSAAIRDMDVIATR